MHQRALLAVIALTTAIAVPAEAQLVNGKWQAPAKQGGSTATTPKKGVQVQETPKPARSNPNAAVPLRVIQAVVMSDGRILADFGFGLEAVTRSCPMAASSMPLQVIGVSQLPDARTPAPALTAQQKAVSKEAAQASCHLRDSRGGVFATR